jgi:hypothetical protein
MKWYEKIVFITAILVVADYFLDIVDLLKELYVLESFE